MLKNDLAKTVFTLLFIGLLMVAVFWIVKPFILGIAWGLMIVVATWPAMIFVQQLLWNKRSLSALVFTTVILLIFIIPIFLSINTIISNSELLTQWIKYFSRDSIPDLVWLSKIPLVGNELYTWWHTVIQDNGTELLNKIQPYFGRATIWLFGQLGNIGQLAIHAVIMIIACVFFYLKGELITASVKRFTQALAPDRGIPVLTIIVQAIRSVALGVVVTALAQSIIGGIGLIITNVPYAVILSIVLFVLCIAQLGPLFLLIPIVIWQYWDGQLINAIMLGILSLFLSIMDSFIRPILIKKGVDLPLSLVLLGVIGGLLAFGMIGLFIGPVVLAVSQRLLTAWIEQRTTYNTPIDK